MICCAKPCLVNDKTKDREKRTIPCNSPGCPKVFHALCIGHGKKTDKELSNFFFVCLKCEEYLNYSADIARKSFMTDLDVRLHDLRISIDKSIDEKIQLESERIDEKIRLECRKIMEEAKLLYESVAKRCDAKIDEVKGLVNDSKSLTLGLMNEKAANIDCLQSELQSLKRSLVKDSSHLTNACDTMRNHIRALELDKRKSSFVIRNFPEKNVYIRGKSVTNCNEAVALIAEELGIENDVMRQVHNVFRIGRVNRADHSEAKPRLIMVRATEKVAKQFLSKARLLKQSNAPLNRVYLQEDLPPEMNKQLADMRKRAYEHRMRYPGESAYVKNKKLFINGVVVEEAHQGF